LISYSTQMRVKRSLRAGSTLPLAWSAGIAALVAGCAQLHAAFGTLLCALVVLRFMPQLRDLGAADATQIRELARCTSRLIYLMLYSVLFLKFFAELTTFSWHDEGLALRWSVHFQTAPERVFVECGERFRVDLLWGVIALCLIRALSAYQLRANPARATALPLKTSSPLQQQRPEVQS
jgi:cytochrome b561